jgi:hypothetical protein
MRLKAKVTFECTYVVEDRTSGTIENMVSLEKEAAEDDIYLFLDFFKDAPKIEITVVEEGG